MTLVEELAQLDDDEFQRRWERLTPEARIAAAAELRRMALLRRFPSPADLMVGLNPSLVVTPALRLISDYLVKVSDALEVAYARQRRRMALLREGVEDRVAIERATEEIASDGILRLMVSMPPQEGKSTLVTRYGTLWDLIRFPQMRQVIVSYDGDKASEFTYAVRSDVEVFNGRSSEIDLGLRLMPDQKAMSRWHLTSGGSVYGIGIRGGLTGRPADKLGIDDPVKDTQAAESVMLARQNVAWWETVARPRLGPWTPVVLTMTRWAENDMGGLMLQLSERLRSEGVRNYDQWTVVNIPAEADHNPAKGERDVLGREPGEFIISARGRTQADWETTKASTSPRWWNSLYQGNPTPASGNTFKREWFRYFDQAIWHQRIDGSFDLDGYGVSMSIDAAFKKKSDTDFVTCGVYARKGSQAFLVYLLRARLDFPETLDAIRRISRMFPGARAKLIEDAANGPAIIATLKKEIPGIIPVKVRGSKTARADAVTPFVRAGNLLLPSPEVLRVAPELSWDVEAFVDECAAFPFGTHDDQVDQLTQYLDQEFRRSPSEWQRAVVAPKPAAELTPMQRRLARSLEK